MSRLSRTKKNVKLTTTSVKRKNQRHRRPSRRPTSLQVEARRGKVNHAHTRAPTRSHMEFTGEKIDMWKRVNHCLMSGFLPTSRSCPDAPSGWVTDRRWSNRRKSSSKIFHGIRGSLMAAEDSKDGGELARVRYDH